MASISPFLNLSAWCESMEDMRKTDWSPGWMFWFDYVFYNPVICLIAVVGNVLCMRVIFQQAKVNPVFYLQLGVMGTDIGVILFFTVLLGLNQVVGLTWNRGSDSLQEYYVLVWWAAFTTYIPVNICLTADVLIVLSTGLYKLYAMKCPMEFKTLQHKKVAILVTAGSYLIAIITCIQEMIRPSIQFCAEVGRYYIYYETDLHVVLRLMAYVRLGVRMVATITLAIVSIFVSYTYYKIEKNRPSQKSRTRAQKQEAIDSKLLTLLLMVQSATLIVGLIGLYVWYMSIYIFASIPPAWFAGTIDFICATSFVTNLLFYVGMSKDFRRKLKASVPFLAQMTNTVSVQPAPIYDGTKTVSQAPG